MNRSPSPLERLGNALAFTLVLLILGFGAYSVWGIVQQDWDLLALGGSEEVRPSPIVVVRQPTLTPIAGLDLVPTASPSPIFQQPTPAPPTATSEPQIAAVLPPTDTPLPSPSPTVELPPTLTPAPPTATAAPPTATPLPSATPVPPTPEPTATPALAFRVAAAGADYGRGCSGFYIFGWVRDSAGNPLPGLRVRVTSEYGYQIPPATTKDDPRGWYDVPISGQRSRWFVQVVDAGNNPLSPSVEVLNTGNFVAGSEGCWHQVDFARTS